MEIQTFILLLFESPQTFLWTLENPFLIRTSVWCIHLIAVYFPRKGLGPATFNLKAETYFTGKKLQHSGPIHPLGLRHSSLTLLKADPYLDEYPSLLSNCCVRRNSKYFTNLDFPEIRGPISLTLTTIWSENSCFRSRANLTRPKNHSQTGGPIALPYLNPYMSPSPTTKKKPSETSQPSKIPKHQPAIWLTGSARTFHPIHLNKPSTHQPIQFFFHGTNFPIKKNTPKSVCKLDTVSCQKVGCYSSRSSPQGFFSGSPVGQSHLDLSKVSIFRRRWAAHKASSRFPVSVR